MGVQVKLESLSVQVGAPLNTTATPAACGPLCHATLIVDATAPLVSAYAALGLVVVAEQRISSAQATAWGHSVLHDRRCVELGAGSPAQTLLRLIEVPGTPARPTRFSHGWLALEILVRDVDALALALPAGAFDVVGAPADLALTPHIRAMQVVGPAGEMLYLTQVKAPVPPFVLPLSAGLPATQPVGALFIAVLSTPSRETVLHNLAALAPLATLRFETKVTVLNRALGRPINTTWPLATAQFAGASLFEIDEVQDPEVGAAPRVGGLPAGLAWVTLLAPEAQGNGRLFEVSPGAWLELKTRS
jgi:hypothetical protein